MSKFVVPEVLEVHEVPSEEVRMVPDAPTATNESLDVVLLLSLFLAQEMTVRLKMDIRIKCKIFFILYPKSKKFIANVKVTYSYFRIRNSE